eukprot:CAMPEP_0185550564 /NCGR_PEP_ID=MMETSP1381-20130426/21916_1 /TAXON_ID=298111 /ORGANISM="Pavlova sp., Strain CCMP459" /LENGTH=157 /DNA_ID=CAMNT_0028163359 /DNA_START=19 /DNA_END=492 /DNA_ORIENTATION=-
MSLGPACCLCSLLVLHVHTVQNLEVWQPFQNFQPVLLLVAAICEEACVVDVTVEEELGELGKSLEALHLLHVVHLVVAHVEYLEVLQLLDACKANYVVVGDPELLKGPHHRVQALNLLELVPRQGKNLQRFHASQSTDAIDLVAGQTQVLALLERAE